MVLGPNDAEVQQVAAKMQQVGQVQQMTNSLVIATGQMMYSHMMGELALHTEGITQPQCREIAKVCVDLAPYYAEALGLIKVEDHANDQNRVVERKGSGRPTEEQGADSVPADTPSDGSPIICG